jgi:hypothetical protein
MSDNGHSEEENGGGGTRYLVLDDRGEFVLELPEGHYMTFGMVNPGAGDRGYDRNLHCLRVWQGTGNSKVLRAVFGSVRGFRDLSLPLARKVNKEVGNAEWTMDSAGNFDRSVTRRMLPSEFEREPFPGPDDF